MAGKRKYGSSQTQQQKAYWANKRFGRKSWSDYGAARILRGSDFSLSAFGPSYKQATPEQKMNRREAGFTGRGKYGIRRTLGKFAKKQHLGKHLYDAGVAGAVAGATMGPEAVAPAMAAGFTGSGLYGRGLYGRGGYVSNSLISGGKPSMRVSQGYNDNQELVITHCEYIQDVFAPSDSNFHNQQIPVNPGLMETLPWLSQIAANYEEYEFIQLLFHYKSTVDAGNTANGATGTIIMCTNYNSDQKPFSAKEPMIQYHGAQSGRLTDDLDHGVECDPNKNAGTAIRYTRTNTPSGYQSKKDFDLGNFQFAVTNAPSGFYNNQIGELWATYKIKLGKPRLFSSLFKSLPFDRWIDSGPTSQSSWGMYPGDCWALGRTTALTSNGPSVTGVNEQNSLGIKLTPGNLTATDQYGVGLTFPDYMTGTFMIRLKVATKIGIFVSHGSPAILPTISTPMTGNVTLIPKLGPDMDGNSETSHCVATGSEVTWDNTSSMNLVLSVSVTPATAGVDNTIYISFDNCVNAAGICASQLMVVPFNSSLSDRFLLPDGTYTDLSSMGSLF